MSERQPNNPLRTELLGTTYESPLVVASGTLIERYDQIEPYLEAGAGAVIPRSTRKEMVRKVHPSPHLYQDGKGSRADMINGEWTGADINYWRPYLDRMAETGKVIMSVSGRDIDGCVEVCRELDQYGFPLFEINISCGVSNGVHGYITRNQEHVTQVVSEVKAAGVETPISLKIAHSDGIIDIAGTAKEAGADAITAINTFGPVFDFYIDENGIPRRAVGATGAKGGLSGRSLFNIALTDVAEIRRQIDIPVLASGGVMEPEQVVKMVMAGASLVQLYTALHIKGNHAPEALAKLERGVLDYMAKHAIASTVSVEGIALPLMEAPTELSPQKPVVQQLGCIGCDACIRVCLPGAFDIVETSSNKVGHVVAVNDDCVGCGHCVSQCPVPGVLTLPAELYEGAREA